MFAKDLELTPDRSTDVLSTLRVKNGEQTLTKCPPSKGLVPDSKADTPIAKAVAQLERKIDAVWRWTEHMHASMRIQISAEVVKRKVIRTPSTSAAAVR